MTDGNRSTDLDILGTKPITEAFARAVDGARNFLGRICNPAADEFGLLLQDQIKGWRINNIVTILAKAEKKLKAQANADRLAAHPQLVARVVDGGSWVDDSVVQDMWAGLLSSSCTEQGDDDSNLLFTDVLAVITKLQARVINYACSTCNKLASPSGLLTAQHFFSNERISIDKLILITDEQDVHRIDRELDHLRDIGLLASPAGFDSHAKPLIADLTPSTFALHMYVRCQGTRISPLEFFGVESVPDASELSSQP